MITGTVPETITLHLEPASPVKESFVPFLKLKKSFLYIGNSSERTTNCLSFFDYSHTAENFHDARHLLTGLYESGSKPDFIIIDLPLAKRELSDFVLWLHANKWSFMIPVMYNETILSEAELIELSELSIADDIVNIEEFCNQLSPKATLISGLKLNKVREPIDEVAQQKLKETTPIGKRIFDIVIASLLLLITFPVFLIIALIIKLESKGPVIYKSKRAGRGFRVFDFYKFRTMIQGADKIIDEYARLNAYGSSKADDSRFIKIKDDPRVTRFGKFLRNTSLDELPQLINVLKGDMSIVGNRPLPLYEATTLTTNNDAERFIAPAGITGLWQVTKRGREDMDAAERIGLDIAYARKQSFYMDFRILIRTPFALIQKSNV